MRSFRKILVPTDFSPVADRALGYALPLAAALGAEVILLHVLAYPYDWYYWEASELDSLRREVEETALRKLRGLVTPDTPVTVRPRLDLHSDVGTTVLRVAGEEAADLIVMGTRGWAEKRTDLGSVAARVTRRSRCPVLTIDDRAADTGSGAEHTSPRVLVPVDPSEAAGEALRVGAALAAALGGRVEILHVVPEEPFDPAYLGGEPDGASDPPLAAQQAEAINRFVEKTLDAPVPVEVALAEGDIVDEALRYAEAEGVDLIVLGISRDDARRHKAEDLAHRAPCAVVAVPAASAIPNLAATTAVTDPNSAPEPRGGQRSERAGVGRIG